MTAAVRLGCRVKLAGGTVSHEAKGPAALHVLGQIFAHAEQADQVGELGNGRFASSLFGRACAHRDVRVVRLGESATAADLTMLTADDGHGAYAELAAY